MKKILFLTGTRADFGKTKSLISLLDTQPNFQTFVFITGMHLQEQYGMTRIEIERCHFKNTHTFENQTHETTMDLTLAKTIEGLSAYTKTIKPDLIVVHGDRVETLAGAIVGSLNNILVAHIEGGELSGTVDELIRHSVSKLSHIHFVSNTDAANRLQLMGENKSAIFTIGSPDIDIMFGPNLPTLDTVKEYYQIDFQEFAIVMFHPVTTESHLMQQHANHFVNSLLEDHHHYIVIYPNNDLGSQAIIDAFACLQDNPRFRVFPSLRFEYFLTLLNNSQFIIGNSSAGIREAPCYGIPTINVGTRQQNRASSSQIINCSYAQSDILKALDTIDKQPKMEVENEFGLGNSAALFLSTLNSNELWQISQQKVWNSEVHF